MATATPSTAVTALITAPPKYEAMQKRLLETNPNAFRDMVTTFLEANGRGYWDTDEENVDRLQELYQEVEDRIEGIV